MNFKPLKEFFANFLLYFLFLPMIVLAYMILTQAMKGFYIRRFGWQ